MRRSATALSRRDTDQSGVAAMSVVVNFVAVELVFKIALVPKKSLIEVFAPDCAPQKLPACPETRQLATNLKSRDQKHMTSVHAEILPALAERLGRFVALLDSQFTI